MSDRVAGLDIGSRTIKLVVLDQGEVALHRVHETTFDPLAVSKKLLDGVRYDRLVATGYGRNIAREYFGAETLTEIRAVALGGRRLRPECRTILDIGGQDTKAIALDPEGRVRKFEMNDRCAAGTGRFLEAMAAALGLTMADFVALALSADSGARLSSMCTVFVETEVVSLVARGMPRPEVALGVHQAIGQRAVSMLQRVANEDEILFTGGVARNPCLHRLIETLLKRPVIVPENPQIVAALGAALHTAP